MHEKTFERLWKEWCTIDNMGDLLLFSHRYYPLAYAALKDEKADGESGAKSRAYTVLGACERWLASQMVFSDNYPCR